MMRSLLVGEGDFSYSIQLSEESTDFVASCLAEINPHSPETMNNIRLLRERGVCVRTDVDARKLDNLDDEIVAKGLFDRVVFNFPHIGGKMKIGRNRQLLKDFFVACGNVLDKINGYVEVALCAGQGGTRIDKLRRFDDTWKIEEMASHASFALVDIKPFEAKYTNIGYRSLSKRFNTEGALIHIFQYSGCPPSLCSHNCLRMNYQEEHNAHNSETKQIIDFLKDVNSPAGLSSSSDANAVRSEASTNERKCFHIERNLKFISPFDVDFSFWASDTEDFEAQDFRSHLERWWPDLLITVEGPIDVFRKDDRISRCFRLNIVSPRFTLSKHLVVSKFMEMLRENLTRWIPSAECRS